MTMNNLCLFDTETGLIRDYPRRDEEPVEGLDPRYEVLRIVRQSAPQYDPATHIISETRAIDRDAGEWRWGWIVEPLPPVTPQPDWRIFKRAMMANPAVNGVIGGGLNQAPAAGIAVVDTLLDVARGGDVDDFRGAWVALRRQGLVSPELLQEVRGLALALHLPEAFVAALGGATRPAAVMLGQEWVDAAGDLWVVVRSRDPEGQFLADDPSTPERESLAWEKQT
jgi:hypothetical protein